MRGGGWGEKNKRKASEHEGSKKSRALRSWVTVWCCSTCFFNYQKLLSLVSCLHSLGRRGSADGVPAGWLFRLVPRLCTESGSSQDCSSTNTWVIRAPNLLWRSEVTCVVSFNPQTPFSLNHCFKSRVYWIRSSVLVSWHLVNKCIEYCIIQGLIYFSLLSTPKNPMFCLPYYLLVRMARLFSKTFPKVKLICQKGLLVSAHMWAEGGNVVFSAASVRRPELRAAEPRVWSWISEPPQI